MALELIAQPRKFLKTFDNLKFSFLHTVILILIICLKSDIFLIFSHTFFMCLNGLNMNKKNNFKKVIKIIKSFSLKQFQTFRGTLSFLDLFSFAISA